MTNSPAANFAIGAVLILVAVFSFVFLSGSTAVFIGIAAAIAGVVFLLIGAQGPKREPEPGLGPGLTDSDPWAQFDRVHGLGELGESTYINPIDPDEPRRNT